MARVIRLSNIRKALKLEPDQSINYVIAGRVKTFRVYRSFNFIDLIDGSTNDHLQVIVKKDILNKPELGAYLQCQGNIVSSPGEKQNIEFKVNKLNYLGKCDPVEYPLAHSDLDRFSPDWYRRWTHLRPRTEHFSSLLRVRSELELAIHMIMKQMGFFKVHTPSITSNDSEATSDLFTVKRSKVIRNQSADKTDEQRIIKEGYFLKDVYMISSAQLHLEALAASLSRVYCLATAYRAEPSITSRHMSEFLMLEAEESDIYELEPLMDRVESIIKFVAQYLSNISEYEQDLSSLLKQNESVENFEKLTSSSYIRMDYSEALETLRNKTRQPFDGATSFGSDIGRGHERALLEYCANVPIFITNYPTQLKPFYMKSELDNNDHGRALCFDLIAPFGGEICGGSLREDNTDKLISNLRAMNTKPSDKNPFDWYLDLRRFGSFPHGGFGIGIERLVQSFLGIKSIKDTVAFPRWIGHCPM